MSQLSLFCTTGKEIETVHITPTKEMPIEIFRECYRFSAFAELMDRTPDGKVIWDEDVTTIWSDEMPDVIYHMVQDGMLEVNLEVPKEFFGDNVLDDGVEDVH